jgi:hypothetical protein
MRQTRRLVVTISIATAAVPLIAAGVARAVVITVTNTNDAGSGSLRSAITTANTLTTGDVIEFAIPGAGPHVITLASPLPVITGTNSLVIDGTTQAGYQAGGPPMIVINCANLAVLGSGLQVGAQAVTVRGLCIQNYDNPTASAGIRISNHAVTVEDCYIGTNQAGTAAAGNGRGILVEAGLTLVEIRRCVVSGNITGLELDGSASVFDCRIGTNAAGTAAVPNTSAGVRCQAGHTGVIGGSVISGNPSGVLVLGGRTLISTCRVGTNAAGTAAIPNTVVGVHYQNGAVALASQPQVFSSVISGNTGVAGLVLDTGVNAGAHPGVFVYNNFIGLNAAGTGALPNGTGIQVLSGGGHAIGGIVANHRNVVSGNTGRGIYVTPTAGTVTIKGNYVGTNAAGTGAVPNGTGIGAYAADMRIGDSLNAGAGNVISGNSGVGLEMITSPSLAPSYVQQNMIGVNAAGTAALPNGSDGLRLGGTDHFIGGGAALARNVIGGNLGGGVVFNGSASGIRVLGNSIGTDASGTLNLGNAGHGVAVVCGCVNDCQIGGTTANIIAYNGGDGVWLALGAGNMVQKNSIFLNGQLGIDLSPTQPGGVTPNDPLDADTGPNNLQNFPVLTSVTVPDASTGGSGTHVRGTLSSAPSTTYLLEFFTNTECDPTGMGEGRTWFASASVATNASGVANFDLTVNPPHPGTHVTATATDPAGNTSEFSPCIALREPVWFVRAGATGANTGVSWADAFTDLQSALGVAVAGEEIWVAAGTYRPSAGTDRNATFTLKSGVALLGGFAGVEASRLLRDPAANPTILSGDIGVPGSAADNSLHVVTAPPGVTATAVLDGFTITGGASTTGISGAGLFINAASPTVNRCIIRGNAAAGFGGGVHVANAPQPPTLTACLLLANSGAPGGAISAVGGSGPVLVNCLLASNASSTSGAAARVSAPDSPMTMINCTITGNTSASGAAITFGNPSAALRLYNCILWGNGASQINTASGGGATILYSDVQGGWPDIGNIDADPRFVDPDGPDQVPGTPDDDFRPGPGSPCIDAGKGALLPPGTTTDLAGNPRTVDATLIPDTGGDPYPVVDMGAYEAPAGTPRCAADINSSGTVTPADVALFISIWSASLAAGTLAGDFDHNGTVNPADIAAFVNAWNSAVASGC